MKKITAIIALIGILMSFTATVSAFELTNEEWLTLYNNPAAVRAVIDGRGIIFFYTAEAVTDELRLFPLEYTVSAPEIKFYLPGGNPLIARAIKV
jgi:hypothetical protein